MAVCIGYCYLQFSSCWKAPLLLCTVQTGKSNREVGEVFLGVMCRALPHNGIFLHLLQVNAQTGAAGKT